MNPSPINPDLTERLLEAQRAIWAARALRHPGAFLPPIPRPYGRQP